MEDIFYTFDPIDPGSENEPLTFDLTAWLGSRWTISGTPSASVSPDSSGMTVGSVVAAATLVTVWVSNGTPGTTYTVYLSVSAVDANSNTRGPIKIGAQITCKTPVPVS